MSEVKLVKYMGNKLVNTQQYGEKTKFKFSCNCKTFNDGKDFFADAWAGQATGQWKEGMTVNAKIVPNDYKGKTYFELKPMQESSQQSGMPSSELLSRLDSIDKKLKTILDNQAGINNFDPESFGEDDERI